MRNIYYITITIGIMLSGISCKEKNIAPAKQLTHDIPVALEQVEERDVSRSITIYGSLTTADEVKLSFKTAGIISHIYAKEGDMIHKGKILAQLDFTEIEAQVIQAKERSAQAAREYQRSKTLYGDSVISLEQYQNAETVWILSKQALEIMEYNKTNSCIVASHAGVILKKHANEGELINIGSPVFTIASDSKKGLLLKSGVTLADWKNMSVGDKAIITIDGIPQKEFNGVVQHISHAADISSGLHTIEIKILHDDQDITIGMFAKARIPVNKMSNYKCIPLSSLQEIDGNTGFVYIPDNNKVKKIPVSISFVEDGFAYISHGLADITYIINEGSGFLSENSTISIASN